RCVPYRFAVTQDNHLRSLVTNPSPVRELVRDVTRRLHLEDVDAVYLFHFAISARANRARVAVLEHDDGLLRRVCQKVLECCLVVDSEKAVSHSSKFSSVVFVLTL